MKKPKPTKEERQEQRNDQRIFKDLIKRLAAKGISYQVEGPKPFSPQNLPPIN